MQQRKVKRFQRPDGRWYAVVIENRREGPVYVRYAKETHKCYDPPGWAFDAVGFDWALSAGITGIEVRTESAIYSCPAEVAAQTGIAVEFGAGPQVLVPLHHWAVKIKNPRWEQLSLFAEVH